MATWNSTGLHDNSDGSGWPRGTRLGIRTTLTVLDGHLDELERTGRLAESPNSTGHHDNSDGSGWPRGTRLGTMTTLTVVDGHVELNWAS